MASSRRYLDQRDLGPRFRRLDHRPGVAVPRAGSGQYSTVCAVLKCCSPQLRCGSSVTGVPRLGQGTARYSSGAQLMGSRPTSESGASLGTARHRSATLDPASDSTPGTWTLGHPEPRPAPWSSVNTRLARQNVSLVRARNCTAFGPNTASAPRATVFVCFAFWSTARTHSGGWAKNV